MKILKLLAVVGVSGFVFAACTHINNLDVGPESSEMDGQTNEYMNNEYMNEEAMEEEMEEEMIEDDSMMMDVNDGDNLMMEADQTVEIVARNYSFTSNQIIASPGETVTVELTSEQGFHDFRLDEFDVKSEQINTGESTSVTFTIPSDTAPGSIYDFYCSVGNHRQMGMVGTLKVE